MSHHRLSFEQYLGVVGDIDSETFVLAATAQEILAVRHWPIFQWNGMPKHFFRLFLGQPLSLEFVGVRRINRCMRGPIAAKFSTYTSTPMYLASKTPDR